MNNVAYSQAFFKSSSRSLKTCEPCSNSSLVIFWEFKFEFTNFYRSCSFQVDFIGFGLSLSNFCQV